MKILARNVVGKTLELTVEPSTTVSQVKDMLEDEYERQSLRLCLQGAVLEDAKTMEECKVTEGTVLILAGRKRAIPKSTIPTQAPAEPAKAPAAKEPEAKSPEDKGAEAKASTAKEEETGAPAAPQPDAAANPAPTTATPPVPATTTPAPPAPPAPPAATAGVDPSLIDNLVSMGFDDREQVALALRAAYMNPDRAVDYLLSGIPPNLVAELSATTAPAPTAGTTATSMSTAASVPPSDLRTLLFTIPQFNNIRSVFQEDSSAMPTIMSQIASRYPQIYSQIEAHPDEFLAIMAETGEPATVGSGSGASLSADTLLAHAPQELELTAADEAAVNNLVQIGGGMWDAPGALLVYLATQRNQEVAASILFENGGVPPELIQAIAEQMNAEDAEFEDEEGDDQEH